MPKVKVPRKSTAIDMTAMCDVAFLLLTFFMLTTQFKGEESIVVDTPSSIAEFKVPEKNIITISIDKTGKVVFSLDGKFKRLAMIRMINDKFLNGQLTTEEMDKFSNLPGFGVPIQGLPAFLRNESFELTKKEFNPGIPIDTTIDETKNQLLTWVSYARVASAQRNLEDPKVGKPIAADVAVKADQNVPYSIINGVLKTLQTKKINKFILVTDLDKTDKPIQE